MGGGAIYTGLTQKQEAGLSPRGRGSRVYHDHPAEKAGSIPAWAGEPEMALSKPGKVGVYPRVGGGA